MQPIPPTIEALRELRRLGDDTVGHILLSMSRDVERIAPDVVGLSLSLLADDLTFTMTATTDPVAVLGAVPSTLSLPILRRGTVAAGVDLYGGTSDAFDGRHEDLARVCGAWPGGAVTNADLAFTTRLRAGEAVDQLQDRTLIDLAVGALVSHWSLSVEAAERRLVDAAHRAGITDTQGARMVMRLLVAPPMGAAVGRC